MIHARPSRRLAFPGAHNLRDLGGYPVPGGRETLWRRVLRGDGLHGLDSAATEALRAEGVATVIDLRSAEEAAEAPNPFAGRPDVAFHNLPVYDELAPTLARAREARSENPLLEFYLAALTGRGEAIRVILATVAGAPDGAVLFHCTAGKDRTGLVAALVLGAVGVARADIIEDYALTGDLIRPLAAALLDRTRLAGGDVGMHARFLACERPTMAAALDDLERQHGSIAGYLGDIGVTKGELSAIRDRLLGA